MIKLFVIASIVLSTILMVLFETAGVGINISDFLTIR